MAPARLGAQPLDRVEIVRGVDLLSEDGVERGHSEIAAVGETVGINDLDGVTFQRQMCVWLGFTVLLEVSSQPQKRLLLTWQQSAGRIFRGGLSGHEVNAMKRQPGFERRIDRWRWWILNRDLGRSLRIQSTRVGAGCALSRSSPGPPTLPSPAPAQQPQRDAHDHRATDHVGLHGGSVRGDCPGLLGNGDCPRYCLR